MDSWEDTMTLMVKGCKKQCMSLTFKLRIVGKKKFRRRQVNPDHVPRVFVAWKADGSRGRRDEKEFVMKRTV